MANLLQSLQLPPASRIAVQVDKSVEALMLYLATLRSGHVFLPLNTAYQAAEIEYFVGNAEPAVVVCTPANFGWVSKIAFTSGVAHVYTLGDDRSGIAAGARRPPWRRARGGGARRGRPGRHPLHQRHHGPQQGAMLTHGNMLSNAETLKDYWGWQDGDVLIHALPIFHVHGLFVAIHGALLNGSPMIWLARFEPGTVISRMRDATVFMGVPTLYVRMLADARLTRGGGPHAAVHLGLGTHAGGDAPRLAGAHRPRHPGALRHERDHHADLQPLPCR